MDMDFVLCDLFISWIGLPFYLVISLITFTFSLYYHLVIKPPKHCRLALLFLPQHYFQRVTNFLSPLRPRKPV